jgi:hypothetical protein
LTEVIPRLVLHPVFKKHLKKIGANTMFSIGDFALSQKTGQFGKVMGYGGLLRDEYQMTLKVMIVDAEGIVDRIEEDLSSTWKKLEDLLEA